MRSAPPPDKQGVDELTKEFLVESQEGLDRMERCMTELENRPGDAELLAEIFRAVHTIKGTTGFFALPRLEKLAHAGEHLLGLLRDRKLPATSPVIDLLLELLDGLRRVLTLIETTGHEGPDAADAELIAVLEEACAGGTGQIERYVAEGVKEPEAAAVAKGTAADRTLRVDVEMLDRMMDQVGELVLMRNQILQSSGEGEQFLQLMRRLDGVTIRLKDTMTRARTQPVGQLFQKFPRMVRDLAQQCGRKVRLDLNGHETRLDKTLLEALKDPITHAMRNAVDHGIEAPAERMKCGKNAEGLLRLCAHREGGQVVIEVSDDGAGIDTQALAMRAVAQKLISPERASEMSEKEALQLIFLPGFTTREEVTTISGRGVGMDVVRANVESLGGVVEIESKVGAGSTLRMRVPMTLAIIPALVVRCGGANYVIPRNTVSELAIVAREDESRLVRMMGGTRMFQLRDESMPLVALADLLGAVKDDANGYYVAVVEVKGRRFGLVVDDLLDPQEIVVKPVARILRQVGIFSGASILGNGELALILDIAGIAARSQATLEATACVELPLAQVRAVPLDIAHTVLVFEDHRGLRDVLPLAMVERVQRVPVNNVDGAIMQFEGQPMRFKDAGGLLASAPSDGAVTVVICRDEDRGARFGLVVRKVFDIASGDVLPKRGARDTDASLPQFLEVA